MDTNTNVGYKGEVKISLCHNNRKIKTKSYHNAGGLPLFQFLCWCLKSEYQAANRYRPSKIRLFNFIGQSKLDSDGRTHDILPEDVEANPTYYFDYSKGNIDPSSTNYIVMSTTPRVVSSKDDRKCTATFTFNVPAAYITDKIAALALYSVGHTDTKTVSGLSNNADYCAYILLTKEVTDEEGVTQVVFDPIDIPSGNLETYNLLIEWKMTILNAKPKNSTDTSMTKAEIEAEIARLRQLLVTKISS